VTVRRFAPQAALVAAAVLYGVTYAAVQGALETMTPMGFNVLRFALGTTVLLPVAVAWGWRGPEPRRSDTRRSFLAAGAALGIAAGIGYFTQNVGLQHTSTSNVAFITGLFAVFTPAFEAVLHRRPPRPEVIGAVALALGGMFLLTGARLTLNLGDAMALVAAASFGWWYVLMGETANRFDFVSLTAVQLGATALFSLPVALVTGFGTVTSKVVVAVVVTAVGSSALAVSLSTWAQRRVDASRASLINLLEPVVAAIIGFVIGERIGGWGVVGAALILVAILVAERGLARGGYRLPTVSPEAGGPLTPAGHDPGPDPGRAGVGEGDPPVPPPPA